MAHLTLLNALELHGKNNKCLAQHCSTHRQKHKIFSLLPQSGEQEWYPTCNGMKGEGTIWQTSAVPGFNFIDIELFIIHL